MADITLPIHVERDEQELEFTAHADVSLGCPARGMFGPPEFAEPPEPADVEWQSVTGDGETLAPEEFESRYGVKLSDYFDRAVESAAEAEGDRADPAGDHAYDLMREERDFGWGDG